MLTIGACADASKCPGYQLRAAKVDSAYKSRDPQWLADEARALVEAIPASATSSEQNLRTAAERILKQLEHDPPNETLLDDAVRSVGTYAQSYDTHVCQDQLGALIRGER